MLSSCDESESVWSCLVRKPNIKTNIKTNTKAKIKTKTETMPAQFSLCQYCLKTIAKNDM